MKTINQFTYFNFVFEILQDVENERYTVRVTNYNYITEYPSFTLNSDETPFVTTKEAYMAIHEFLAGELPKPMRPKINPTVIRQSNAA